MRKLTRATAAVAAALVIGLAAAGPAAAATPADKPAVTVGALTVSSSGGASPDTWHTNVTVPVSGYNFTPGGNVYVTFQDITAGTAALTGEWTVAGTGPCGLECNNAGKIGYTRTLSFPYRSVCGHWMRAWAWDQVKSPQTGYGWSYRDVQVAC
jgi:hypothetical protein